jgi:membrane-bound lytic murein transglycosylase A
MNCMDTLHARLKSVAKLRPTPLRSLAGWAGQDFAATLATFRTTCDPILGAGPSLRRGLPVPDPLVQVCRKAVAIPVTASVEQARNFFESNFDAFEVIPNSRAASPAGGFVTGYYEPEVAGSLTKTSKFTEPLLALPASHVVRADGVELGADFPKDLTTALRNANGSYMPYPDRKGIEQGNMGSLTRPVLWVRDGIEAFMIHVQGSARVRLQDGSVLRVKYAGRNGHPYTSIGRVLVNRYNIPPAEMTMQHLKRWVRAAGQKSGEPGRELMQENRSYIFFSIDRSLRENAGPVGGAGVSLTPLRSIAIDRNIWPYGLPYWIDADLPWRSSDVSAPFRRLVIGQDTGSAIVGAARADIFFGSGTRAGTLAGAIRHPARFQVLLPK